MPNENIQTLLIAFFPFLLVLAGVRDIIVIGGGSFSIAWIARQLYLSFIRRREEKEKRREEKEKRAEEKEKRREEKESRAEQKAKAKKEQELLDLQIRKAKRDLGDSDAELGA